jgi:DNA topoisomerase VI subunit A
MALIDTHALVEDLIEAGFKKKQAETIIKVTRKGQNDFANKTDINQLRSDIELAIYKAKFDLLKWITPMFLTNLLLIVGLWFK